MGSVFSSLRRRNRTPVSPISSPSIRPAPVPTPPHPPSTGVSFSPASHAARPFPSRSKVTSLEFLQKACPDAHAYTDSIIHSSIGTTIGDVIPQRNGFVHTILECYNEHRALAIRPDDVWIAILTQFSSFVNGNAEALRSLFVLHYDKKELTVEIDQNDQDWGTVVRQLTEKMEDKIQENVIDPELKQWMIPDFSTTDPTDKLVAGMTMMATVKHYFTYRIMLLCGIPRVTLEGKKDDWVYILNRIEKLKEFGPQITAWYRMLYPILSRFVQAFEEPGNAANLDFWNRVAHVEHMGSGSPMLTGWITAFMVFDEKGRWKGDYKSDLVLDGATYPCMDSDKIPAGYAQVDVLFQRKIRGVLSPERQTSLIAGSIGTKIFSSGDKSLSSAGTRDSARPVLGWWWVFKKGMGPQESIPAPNEFLWRFVDARAFIYSGVIRLVSFKDISNLDFAAISYVWTDEMKKWRGHISSVDGRTYEERIARGSGILSTSTLSADIPDGDAIAHAQLFFTIVAFFVLTRGKKFFWIDILCINQDEYREKGFFVPRMDDLYREAVETHAYPFGAKLPSSVSSDDVLFPVWETRAWTVQEQVLSKRVLFCYALQGNVRQDVMNIEHADRVSGAPRLVDLHTPVLDRYQYADGIYVLQLKGNNVTCHMQEEMGFNFPSSAWIAGFANSSFESAGPNHLRRGFKRRVAYQALAEVKESLHTNIAEAARVCMTMIAGERRSTVPEDMVYSMLGVLNIKSFAVDYTIGFEEARLRVFEALSPEILAHIIGTQWGHGSTANNKDSALPRIVDASPVVCVTSLRPAILRCKYSRNKGTQMNCRRETCRVWAPDERVKRNQAFMRSSLGNDRLLLLQLASVFDLPGIPSMATKDIPRDITKVIVADMSTFGVNSDDEAADVDVIAELVDVGCCDTALVLPSLPELMGKTSLLTLFCESTGSGTFVNKGTVLMMDASALSTEYGDMLIE